MPEITDSTGISDTEPNFWIVGASFGRADDRTTDFLAQHYWQDGWVKAGNEKNKEISQQIKKGDFLVLKASSTKETRHAAAATRLKAIGKITRKLNSYTFSVNWFEDPKLPRNFNGVWYGKTVEALHNDILLEYVRDFVGKQELLLPIVSS